MQHQHYLSGQTPSCDMTLSTHRAIILATLMLSAFVLSAAFTPTRSAIAEANQFQLEAIIPQQFGDWQMDKRIAQAVINPQVQTSLSHIYSQILSRTYINSDGRRIMLSLAYGEDQTSDSRIHRPEVCYPSQGFQIIYKRKDTVFTGSAELPVMRVMTQLGNRHEPVTYWIRVGDSLVRGAIEQTVARVSYGLRGHIPDGILFRISEINADAQDSIVLQDQFIRALLSSLTPLARKVLTGSVEPHTDGVMAE